MTKRQSTAPQWMNSQDAESPLSAYRRTSGEPSLDRMAKSVEQEIIELRDQVREHDRHYYVEAAPFISFFVYDRLCAVL
jgi:hypothetical protein